MRLTVFMMMLSLGSLAHGFFHIEPGVGYNRGHYQTNKAQGIGLALKLGADIGSFILAADVGYHDLQLGAIPAARATDMGLMLGGDFNNWRIWYTHLVSASIVYPSGSDNVTLTGAGSKIGISAKASGKMNLNLEFRSIDLTKNTGPGGETPITEFLDAAMLSVSWVL